MRTLFVFNQHLIYEHAHAKQYDPGFQYDCHGKANEAKQMKKEQHKTVRAENTAQADKAQAVRSSLLKTVHQLEFIVQVKLESDF